MKMNENLRILVGAPLLAATLVAIVATPGFLSDRDSTVPLHVAQEARR